ncbi:hypothetical protein PHYSODRAFT_487263 [Phytophthora sojae]|uniref:GAF domain-containing protein n=1 Tax=Phytophthora sojae (strain P6497) TaxID=1094619 RepID=G4YZ22_PHYSP|nr:hypothetical protein PHYSODRAFT_487263 [Phytophthora sojae]EGZ23303.1 hypothetical protein PHYSODRAFT_487263 [Phytophthora sojae]|eukprot:XP_009518591.1 hypothetical protein PHYSODRAFT_487263 [Phytophthora sojae]
MNDQGNTQSKDLPSAHSDTSGSRSTADEDARGLTVRSARGSCQKTVLSDKEIADDVLATMPKLHAAVRNNATGDRWKRRNGKGGVRLAEFKPNYSSTGAEDDLDILHAVAAKTELKCHLNEALSVLLHQDSDSYDSTMKSLCGKQFKRGEVLFEQHMTFDAESQRKTRVPLDDKAPRQGLITVTSTAINPSVSLQRRLQSRHSRTQKLVFSTCTHQYPSKKRALHLMKTVPKDVHDQVLTTAECSALRGEIDHIGVGFDLQFTSSAGGSNRQRTTIFAHAYASDRSPSTFSTNSPDGPEVETNPKAAKLARRRVAVMNSDSLTVMRTLTESLSNFERIIRLTFHFFRRDFYCELCGHMVCGDCSAVYEVEARIGQIRKSRCCGQCVARVDSCKFDDDDLLAALGPVIVETASDAWLPTEGSILSLPSGDEEDAPPESDDSDLNAQLCSKDPAVRTHALEILGNLVASSANTSASSSPPSKSTTSEEAKDLQESRTKREKSQVQRVLASVEGHINEELLKSRAKVNAGTCDVNDHTRDYKYEFDSTKVSNEDIPLAPVPEAQKEARRVDFVKSCGALQPEYDRSALNLIAEVAAKRLGCPIGLVSMIDDEQFHAIGRYNIPVEAHHLPRNEVLCMHAVYAEKPFVIKNCQRDMRVSKFPLVNDYGLKFYAGFPLRAPNGDVVGNLCAIDAVAHNNISTKDYSTMETLAKLASDLLAPPTGRGA